MKGIYTQLFKRFIVAVIAAILEIGAIYATVAYGEALIGRDASLIVGVVVALIIFGVSTNKIRNIDCL